MAIQKTMRALTVNYRILLPIAGAILIAAIFKLFANKDSSVGVSHVMERLAYHQGYLTIRAFDNAICWCCNRNYFRSITRA